MFDLKLDNYQRQQMVLAEIEYQLTTMKQYLSVEETKAYLLLLNKYGGAWEREYILGKYYKAWGDTVDSWMSDKGYEESTHEKQAEFARKRGVTE